MIDIEISSDRPAVGLRMPASSRSLPVARQAVRSLGEALQADLDSLADAELAVTEACANAIAHAYPSGSGTVELSLRPDGRLLRAEVRDYGRGISERVAAEDSHCEEGYGLALIDSIADDLRIRSGAHGGTVVAMMLGLGARSGKGTAVPSYAPAAERVVRRVTAIFAAQLDLPSDRLVEALLVGELVARLAPPRSAGGRLALRLYERGSGFGYRIGPLVKGGARALLHDASVPVVGSVIERLADEVAVEPASDDLSLEAGGEHLMVAIGFADAA